MPLPEQRPSHIIYIYIYTSIITFIYIFIARVNILGVLGMRREKGKRKDSPIGGNKHRESMLLVSPS